MKIASVRISNILGIEELEFRAGNFNEISGPNGSGKSSVLAAIQAVLEGGQDATLIRKGAEKGEAVLVLDDGTNIRKRFSAKGKGTLHVEKNGVVADKPQSVIDGLRDMLSVNPVDFLRAPKKQRVNVLLEALPMTADVTRLEEIIGHKPDIVFGEHALTAIDRVYVSVYDDRTGTNRAAKEKRNTISQLESALPAGFEDDASGDLDGLLAQKTKADSDRDAEMTRIDAKLATFRTSTEQKRDSIRTRHQTSIDSLLAQIEAVKVERDAELEAERKAHQNIEDAAAKQKQITVERHAAAVTPVMTQITTVQQNQETAARARVTRQTIAKMTTEAEALEADSDKQTAALTALENYKSELLSRLPIDGLEVKAGEISRHGIPFDRLNSGQQVEIAVEIAKLRAGRLGVIAVDGIELLDGEHYEAFRQQMQDTGLQMFVARVTDGDFTVTTN